MSTQTYNPAEYWRITAPDGTQVVANLYTSQQPALTFGDTPEFSFLFRRLPGESRTAYQDRHAKLLAYDGHAGAYNAKLTVANTPRYTEAHGWSESLLVGIEPPDAKQADGTGRGLWGLVDGVDDATNRAQTRWAIDLTVYYLADYDEYANAQAVRSELEAGGPY